MIPVFILFIALQFLITGLKEYEQINYNEDIRLGKSMLHERRCVRIISGEKSHLLRQPWYQNY